MTDDLDDLKQALNAATPVPDSVVRTAHLALAQKNFADLQGSRDDARPMSNRPTRGFWTGALDMLNTLTGSFAIIRSGAFGEDGATLQTDGEAKLVAKFSEEGAAPPTLTPLTSDSSDGTLSPPTKAPKSDARIGGMVATVALLLMGLLVWLMIWIGS